jgi:hypothetical protein
MIRTLEKAAEIEKRGLSAAFAERCALNRKVCTNWSLCIFALRVLAAPFFLCGVVTMSDEVVGDVCELLEVIETEQVVEILDDTQFLDLVAPMETRGEMPGGGCSDFCEVPAEETQLAGQKRKRIEVRGDLEEAGVFGVSLPTAVVPPSPRLVLATPLLPPPKPHSSTPHQTSENTTTHHLQNTDPANPSPLLPAVNIQLTSEELQALFGILQQRGSTQNPCSSSSTTVFSSSTSSQAQTHHQHYQVRHSALSVCRYTFCRCKFFPH